MTSHFTAIVNALQERRARPRLTPDQKAAPKDVSRTESIRALLRESGPLTSRQIALILNLDRESLVGALLKADLHSGRAYFQDGRYHWDGKYDEQLQREIADAAHLLRKHGYSVTRIST